MDAKRMRILFVDDDELEIVEILKKEGYDVEYWSDIESLERLSDGRYQIVFLDVRGVGAKYNGNGLDALRYLAEHNPLVYRVVFSAKPFTPEENEVTRKYASKVLTKDTSAYDFIDTIDGHARAITKKRLIQDVERMMPIGWYVRWKLKRGNKLTEKQVRRLAAISSLGADSVSIVSNVTSIAAILFKALAASG